MSSFTLENYDVAFSTDDNGADVALLVIEKKDLPAISGSPNKGILLSGSPESGTDELRRLRVVFQDRAGPPRDELNEMFELLLDLPLAVYDALSGFNRLYICEVNEGQVVSEYKIDVFHEAV